MLGKLPTNNLPQNPETADSLVIPGGGGTSI